MVGPLKRLASDARLDVRGAAAYASTRLQHPTVSGDIVSMAKEFETKFADDDYAMIQRQRRFGELERDYPRS